MTEMDVDFKADFKEMVIEGYGLYSFGSEQEPMANSCEHRNKS
jgi:hypothetical protein